MMWGRNGYAHAGLLTVCLPDDVEDESGEKGGLEKAMRTEQEVEAEHYPPKSESRST